MVETATRRDRDNIDGYESLWPSLSEAPLPPWCVVYQREHGNSNHCRFKRIKQVSLLLPGFLSRVNLTVFGVFRVGNGYSSNKS